MKKPKVMKIKGSAYYRALDVIERVQIWLCQTLAIILIGVVFLQVLARFILHWEVLWTLEISIFCFVWTIMLGSSVAVRRGLHYTIDVFPRHYFLIKFIGYIGILVVALVFAWYGTNFAIAEWKRFSQPSMIRITFFVSAIPVMGVTSVLFIIEKIIQDFFSSQKNLD
ncbi:MAG: TRAP transporter small permease [Thermodesulfobacteriota bacterium]